MEEKKVKQEEIKPKSNCKWCYGRGYIGIDHKTKSQIICRCIIKQQEKETKLGIREGRIKVRPLNDLGSRLIIKKG